MSVRKVPKPSIEARQLSWCNTQLYEGETLEGFDLKLRPISVMLQGSSAFLDAVGCFLGFLPSTEKM